MPKKKRKKIEKTDSIIRIKDLMFQYDNSKKTIIDNLNLDIKEGEFIGIAGPSGCGKSSLIKVLAKLEQGKGDVALNNKDLDTYSRKEISDFIALVPQTPFLIAGTIKENICYGLNRKITDKEIKEAAKRAYLDEFIENLPEKYDFKISEGGNNLSGGQRQRIALARIFLRKPRILILDEATSALDNTSEKYIQTEIEKLQKENNTTILSIAHRLSTLKNCDKILVFAKGKIVQNGKYKELINQEGIFKDMYEGKLK